MLKCCRRDLFNTKSCSANYRVSIICFFASLYNAWYDDYDDSAASAVNDTRYRSIPILLRIVICAANL